MNDVLSVVIPIGEMNQWVDIAVESALSQTGLEELGAELEVVTIFNNGALMPTNWKFASDKRVRVIEIAESLGVGGAGQTGIDAARGSFVFRLDADDVMRHDRLALQVQCLRRSPDTVLVGSRVECIDTEGVTVGAFNLPTGDDIRVALLSENVCPHSSWGVRKSALVTVGGYDSSMNQMEDYDLLLRLAKLGPIAILPEALAKYRLHPHQVSRMARPNGHYIATIAKRRKALGQVLGAPDWQIWKARVAWEAEQWLMFIGRKLRTMLT